MRPKRKRTEVRTRAEQNIVHVAGALYGWALATLDRPIRLGDVLNQARATNNTSSGWTIDVRYDDEDYTDDRSWTRVEGLVLSDEDLIAAMGLAMQWIVRDNPETVT